MAEVSLDMLQLFAAVTSDKDKAKRLAEIQAALEAVQAEREALDKHREEISALSEAARKDKAEALAMIADLGSREADLKSETEGLASAIKSHNDEVKQFAEIREKIELEQAAREDAVEKIERRQTEVAGEMARREKDLREREAIVAKLAESLDRKHGALKEAMAA